MVVRVASRKMALNPKWFKDLKEAHSVNNKTNRGYIQLATVRPNGMPANRTVVFRNFFHDTPLLSICIDTRSEKAEQIEHFPFGEIAWYMPETREQFRLSGRLFIVGNDRVIGYEPTLSAWGLEKIDWAEERLKLWKALSDGMRAGFASPQPGDDIDPGVELVKTLPKDQPTNTEAKALYDTALAHFGLVIFATERVDHLELMGFPPRRTKHSRNEHGLWEHKPVNP
eukprot:Colp12_sorted_trinity150504_noHs@6905